MSDYIRRERVERQLEEDVRVERRERFREYPPVDEQTAKTCREKFQNHSKTHGLPFIAKAA